MMKKNIFAIILLLMTTVMAQAQNVTIKGNVTDERGEVLIGATVKPVGSQGGTVTDIDGNYQLSVKQGVKQVEVSYIGYRTQKVNVKTDWPMSRCVKMATS